jgi:2',3'-cyclic-nucleotide 2'-phosphodiesterase (5'-nucleotidase family)
MAPRLLHYSDVENAYDDPGRIGRLAGLLKRRRGPDAVVAGTGDNTAPGVSSLVTEGEVALPFFDAVGSDVETFGNHDFDYGPERTLELVERSPQTWITANVRRNGDRFGAEVGTVSRAVLERGGARIGVVGLTEPNTDQMNPNTGDVTFEDPLPAARKGLAALRDRDVDYTVALSHLGRGDEELAVAFDFDVVLGGHLHTEAVERVDGTLLTRPGVNGEVLLEVDLETKSVERHETADGPLDETVANAMRERRAGADLDEVVAVVTDPIERTQRAAFRGESRVGNFVADAYRWATGADVGLQNSGGIRAGDPLVGEVTVGDLVSVVPFEEPVAVIEVTGERLVEALEQAHGHRVAFGEPEWWHAHLSGARVVHDGGGTVDRVTVDGAPVDPDRTYTVASSSYVFGTDHEFPALSGDPVTVCDLQHEVLAAYARQKGIDPEVEGRVVHGETRAD